MKRLGYVVVLVVLAVGCSSRSSPLGSSHPVGSVPAPPPPTAAVALANRLLDDTVLPPGAKPYTGHSGSVSHWLVSDPAGTPGLVNLVQAHRFWMMRSTAEDVAGFAQKHRPHGFTGYGFGSAGTSGSHTDRALFTTDELAVLPPNISDAQLDVSVADAGPATVVIRVDALVAWTQPRPQTEYARARDRVVILTVTHVDESKPRPGKRVVSTRAVLVEPIVQSFDGAASVSAAVPVRMSFRARVLRMNRLRSLSERATRPRRHDRALRRNRSQAREPTRCCPSTRVMHSPNQWRTCSARRNSTHELRRVARF